MNARYSLVLKEVSLIDAEELKVGVPATDLDVVEPEIGSESHNELATIIILALSAPALSAMTMWLLRTTQNETIDYRTTVRKPDGSEEEVHLKIKRNSSTAPEAQVIKQMAAALKIPEDALLKLAPYK